MSEAAGPAFDAIVLAGGRGSRLGGVSKADLMVGGVRLLDRVLDAVRSAESRVVVGDVTVPDGVLRTQEEPSGTGPAAGLAAGLAAIDEPAAWTLLLACDIPEASVAVGRLRAAAASGIAGGYAMSNAAGEPEWLLGIYRSEALRAAVTAYGDPRNRSVRGMLGPLEPSLVEPATGRHGDIDTWADHARWNAFYRRKGRAMSQGKPAPGGDHRELEWAPFVARACEAVGVDPAMVDIAAILDMTREIAHAGARPMAPVGAYILGIAVGRGGDPDYLRRVLEDAASAAPIPLED